MFFIAEIKEIKYKTCGKVHIDLKEEDIYSVNLTTYGNLDMRFLDFDSRKYSKICSHRYVNMQENNKIERILYDYAQVAKI